MTRLLVSVRDVDEALRGRRRGRRPHRPEGAGGRRARRAAARAHRRRSCARCAAASGRADQRDHRRLAGGPARRDRWRASRAWRRCGVDYVKVGIAPGRSAPALLRRAGRQRRAVVPVLLADAGRRRARCSTRRWRRDAFPALMLDTADKRAGSLLRARARCARCAASSRRARHRPAGRARRRAAARRRAELRALAPDFAGFRSAVCAGDRTAALDARARARAYATARRAAAARALLRARCGWPAAAGRPRAAPCEASPQQASRTRASSSPCDDLDRERRVAAPSAAKRGSTTPRRPARPA